MSLYFRPGQHGRLGAGHHNGASGRMEGRFRQLLGLRRFVAGFQDGIPLTQGVEEMERLKARLPVEFLRAIQDPAFLMEVYEGAPRWVVKEIRKAYDVFRSCFGAHGRHERRDPKEVFYPFGLPNDSTGESCSLSLTPEAVLSLWRHRADPFLYPPPAPSPAWRIGFDLSRGTTMMQTWLEVLLRRELRLSDVVLFAQSIVVVTRGLWRMAHLGDLPGTGLPEAVAGLARDLATKLSLVLRAFLPRRGRRVLSGYWRRRLIDEAHTPYVPGGVAQRRRRRMIYAAFYQLECQDPGMLNFTTFISAEELG